MTKPVRKSFTLCEIFFDSKFLLKIAFFILKGYMSKLEIETNLIPYCGLTETIWLANLIHWQKYLFHIEKITSPQDIIYLQQTQITKKLLISKSKQRKIIKKLVMLNLISIERKGWGRRNFYRINETQIERIKNAK